MNRRVTGALSLAPLALGAAATFANPSPPDGPRPDPSSAAHVVATRSTPLRSGPSSTSTRIGTVSEGDVLAVFQHGHRSGYVRVQTPDEDVGWITDASAAPVTEADVDEGASPPATLEGHPSELTVKNGAFDGCPADGDPSANAPNRSDLVALNDGKNRSDAPTDADIDRSITVDKILAPSHDDSHRWSSTKGAEITAYVLDVKFGGKSETANCRKGDAAHRDSHIELVLDEQHTDENQRMIVEITPRFQAAAKAQGLDWSTAGLQKSIQGKWVRFKGWMLFDAEHANQSENTKPGNDGNWRATAWEVHPVTSFEVVPHP